jgi:hypothetical protein
VRWPSSAPIWAATSASINSATIQATLSRNTSACSLASSLSASWAAVILGPSAIPHEHEQFIAHYRGLLAAWVTDQRAARSG